MATAKPKVQSQSGVFIPCPACQRAIELPANGTLPEQLICPNCARRIVR